MNILTRLNKLVELISHHDLADVPITIDQSSYYTKRFNVEVDRAEISDEQARNFKRAFGPFDGVAGHSSKSGNNVLEFEDDSSISATLSRIYVCRTLTTDEVAALSDEEKQAIWDQAEEGVITFQQCSKSEGTADALAAATQIEGNPS